MQKMNYFQVKMMEWCKAFGTSHANPSTGSSYARTNSFWTSVAGPCDCTRRRTPLPLRQDLCDAVLAEVSPILTADYKMDVFFLATTIF